MIDPKTGSGRAVYTPADREIDLARRKLRALGTPAPLGGRAFEAVAVSVQSADADKALDGGCRWSEADRPPIDAVVDQIGGENQVRCFAVLRQGG